MGRILLISGSRGTPSRAQALRGTISRRLSAAGQNVVEAGVTTADLAETVMADQWVSWFRQSAADANAFVFVSPVYHHSFSGVLKLTLDLLDTHHLDRKPVGLCSSSGSQRSSSAIDQLRHVVRGLHGITIPCQIATSDDDWVRDAHTYHLRDDAISQRLDEFCCELCWYASRLDGDVSVGPALSAIGS